MKVLYSISSPCSVFTLPDPLVAVCMDGDASTYLRCQLDIDLANKERGWSQVPYKLSELLALKETLPRQSSNVVLTKEQLRLVWDYLLRQWKLAYDAEDSVLEHAYDELIDVLIFGTTITFTFPLTR